MSLSELLEYIKSLRSDVDIIETFFTQASYSEKIAALEEQTTQEEFWSNPNGGLVLKHLQQLKDEQQQYHTLMTTYTELPELIDLVKDDPQALADVAKEARQLRKKLITFKLLLLLDHAEDKSSCFLHINAGAGGTESQDWASMLLRMYTRFCEKEKYKISLVDFHAGETAGIKSATLFIQGNYAYGYLKSEYGIHRLVRISPFDANKRRHTSFAAVTVMPEQPEVTVTIDPKDLRIDTYRAGGAGGQHVNKTESAVRITHLPTGLVAQCQNERSQLQNKETAMKMLYAKLAQKVKEDQEMIAAGQEKKKIEWGSQIRSYILHPYKMVKDHRTGVESTQPELVLDGDLIPFIEPYLIWMKQQTSSQAD
ncbi:MAG: peptide chain release factor 2 [Candidatus Babeliales bacterium]